MKTTVLSLVALSSSLLLAAQGGSFRFADASKKLTMSSREGRGAKQGTGYKILLVGDVVAKDNQENLELRAQKVDAEVGTVGKASELQRAVADGKVRLTKTVRGTSGVQTTQIDGSRANFQAGAEQSVVDMSGPVTIRNSNPAKQETLVATGNQGKAYLIKGKQTDRPNALNRAELVGNVRTVVTQQAKDGGKLIATGGRMVLEQTATNRTITMTQNVNVTGSGTAQQFSASNMQRVVMVLNAKGEVVEWEAR